MFSQWLTCIFPSWITSITPFPTKAWPNSAKKPISMKERWFIIRILRKRRNFSCIIVCSQDHTLFLETTHFQLFFIIKINFIMLKILANDTPLFHRQLLRFSGMKLFFHVTILLSVISIVYILYIAISSWSILWTHRKAYSEKLQFSTRSSGFTVFI